MVGSFNRLAAAAAFSCVLAGCASAPDSIQLSSSTSMIRSAHAAPRHGVTAPQAFEAPEAPEQCVPYARAHSGIDIRGDAYTWWSQAAGRFARGATPMEGAVMVLTRYGGTHRGHVAVVRSIVSAREIHIDHANWYGDGAIYVDNPVLDVSPDNDWSQVRVWNVRTGSWGTRNYAVQGFIGPADNTDAVHVAQNSGTK
jgi:surface antigen